MNERAEPVRRAVDLEAGIEAVWTALVDDPGIWFGGELTIEPRRGGAVRWRAEDGSERRGMVIACEPPVHLVFRWRELEGAGLTSLRAGPASVVAFVLDPTDEGGTRLTVTDALGESIAEGDSASVHERAVR